MQVLLYKCAVSGRSSQFDTKLSGQLSPDRIMQLIDLLVDKRPLQTPIVNAVAHALSARFRMNKLVNEPDILDIVRTGRWRAMALTGQYL